MLPIWISLAVCALGAVFLVLRYDLYEREPVSMVVVAIGMGAATMWFVGHLEDVSLALAGGPGAGPAVLAGIAATHEELARLLLVAVLALMPSSHLDDPIDGLIYGSVVGLGMALEESRWLLSLIPPDGVLLPGTEVVRLVGHLVLGGITGFPIGMAVVGERRWIVLLVLCVGASTSIHFAWDWLAFSAAAQPAPTAGQSSTAIALMLLGMLVYAALVVRGSTASRAIFAPDSNRTVWF